LRAAAGTDWPQFRGADRSNISKETGLLRKWPAGGPKHLWSGPAGAGVCRGGDRGGAGLPPRLRREEVRVDRELPLSG